MDESPRNGGLVTHDPSTDGQQPEQPARRRRGAQPGNMSALKHGGRSARILNGTSMSQLPAGCEFVERQLRDFRRHLWAELEAIHGEGSIPLAAQVVIQSIMRHEARARLAYRWLRAKGEEAPLNDRLALLQAVSAATDARDRAVRSLGLEVSPAKAEGLFAAIDAQARQATAQATDADDTDDEGGQL